MNGRERPQNNQCLDMGVLLSLHDGELVADERERALAHIATCADCAADERAVAAGSQDVYHLLATSGPRVSEMPSTAAAFAVMQTRLEAEGLSEDRQAGTFSLLKPGGERSTRFVKRRRVGWLAATVAAALIALLVLPNVSALAVQFLSLFQVQQFQPVDINPQDFSQAFLFDIARYGDIDQNNFDTSLQPASAIQVKQTIHFPLLLPGHLPPGVGQNASFALMNGGVVTFVFRASMARAYLEQNGIDNVTIPAQLDGATFTITVQPAVVISYDKVCSQTDTSPRSSYSPEPGQCGGVPFIIAEVPSPIVRGVGNASLEDLRNFFISLPDQSSQIRTLLGDVDLNTGTIPLPIPPQVNAQQITTRGAPGVLLTDNALNLGGILWQTHGIIYAVGGETSNTSELIDTVNSLQ
jgi:hypothetical protein